MRIENQRFQRLVRISLRSGHFSADLLENFLDPDAGLCGGEHRFTGVEADDLLDLLLDSFRIRARKVDLVDDRQNLEVVVECQIYIRQRLGFDSLRRIDNQQRAFAGRKASRYFIGEVDVPRGIDQVENIFLAVIGL